MSRSEWFNPRGGLAISVAAIFAIYLVIPDSGFGGGQVKIRFSWAIFLFGGLLIGSVLRLRPVEAPFSIYVATCLVANLIATSVAVHQYSFAVEDYLAATTSIPKGSTLIRLRYPTPDVPVKYGFHEIARHPLFHLDAYAAVQCDCLDFSDYQAPSRIFPVVFRNQVPRNLQFGLWSLEGPGNSTPKILDDLRRGLPAPIDFVIMVEDGSSTGEGLKTSTRI